MKFAIQIHREIKIKRGEYFLANIWHLMMLMTTIELQRIQKYIRMTFHFYFKFSSFLCKQLTLCAVVPHHHRTRRETCVCSKKRRDFRRKIHLMCMLNKHGEKVLFLLFNVQTNLFYGECEKRQIMKMFCRWLLSWSLWLLYIAFYKK